MQESKPKILGCLKLTYHQEKEPVFWEVWKKNESTFLEVGCLDYGFRFYDPQLGRWHVLDKAIENGHHNYSPYAYVYNNPLRFFDPFGLDSADAAAVTQAAENAVDYVTDNYGSTTAQCNRGVNHAFEELTGNDELANKNANDGRSIGKLR